MSKIICIAEPNSAQEVAIIHMIMSNLDVPYQIENEFYSQTVDGATGLLDARMRLLVNENDAPRVLAMIEEARSGGVSDGEPDDQSSQ